MVTTANIEEAKNMNGITFNVISLSENKFTINISCFAVSQRLKIKIRTPEIIAVTNK